MINKEQEVKSKEVVVGVASYKHYETISEAVEGLGEPKLLELLNAQVRTNAMNAVRNEKVGKPSKTALRNEAISEITGDQWQQIAGNQDKINALIESKMAEIEARRKAASPTTEEADDENES